MVFKYIFNLFIILIAIKRSMNLCVGTLPTVCLTDLTEDDAEEKLKYIFNKYEEVELKITGQPVSVHGKRISYGSMQEYNIGFRYIDNTENDIIQYCEFILLYAPGECERINLYCNTFLPRTPRPLLERETLNVCEDGIARANEQGEDEREIPENQENQESPENEGNSEIPDARTASNI